MRDKFAGRPRAGHSHHEFAEARIAAIFPTGPNATLGRIYDDVYHCAAQLLTGTASGTGLHPPLWNCEVHRTR